MNTQAFATQVLAQPQNYGVSLGAVPAVEPAEDEALNHFVNSAMANWTGAGNDQNLEFRNASNNGEYAESMYYFGGQVRGNQNYMAKRPEQAVKAWFQEVFNNAPPIHSRAERVAVYFARLFERIARVKFSHGLSHSLSASDLWHGHFFKGWSGGAFVLFHAKEGPRDLHAPGPKGNFSSSDLSFQYRNLLWTASDRTVVALDASGKLDEAAKILPSVDSSPIYKNLIIPEAINGKAPLVEGMLPLFQEAAKAKTLGQTFLGHTLGTLNYRCGWFVLATQRIVFSPESRSVAEVIDFDETKVTALLQQHRIPTEQDMNDVYNYREVR